MTTHPNRRKKRLGYKPTKEDVIALRERAGLKQEVIAGLIYCSRVTWSQWESGVRTMHPAFWDILLIRVKEHLERVKEVQENSFIEDTILAKNSNDIF